MSDMENASNPLACLFAIAVEFGGIAEPPSPEHEVPLTQCRALLRSEAADYSTVVEVTSLSRDTATVQYRGELSPTGPATLVWLNSRRPHPELAMTVAEAVVAGPGLWRLRLTAAACSCPTEA